MPIPQPIPESAQIRERRASSRFRAADSLARVGWDDGGRFRTVLARLEDVSYGGARLHVGPPAPSGRTVWIGLGSGDPEDWIEARLVGRDVHGSGTQTIRVSFPSGCPYHRFRRAVWGGESAADLG